MIWNPSAPRLVTIFPFPAFIRRAIEFAVSADHFRMSRHGRGDLAAGRGARTPSPRGSRRRAMPSAALTSGTAKLGAEQPSTPSATCHWRSRTFRRRPPGCPAGSGVRLLR